MEMTDFSGLNTVGKTWNDVSTQFINTEQRSLSFLANVMLKLIFVY